MVGAGKTTVSKTASACESPGTVKNGTAIRSPLHTAESWRSGTPEVLEKKVAEGGQPSMCKGWRREKSPKIPEAGSSVRLEHRLRP